MLCECAEEEDEQLVGGVDGPARAADVRRRRDPHGQPAVQRGAAARRVRRVGARAARAVAVDGHDGPADVPLCVRRAARRHGDRPTPRHGQLVAQRAGSGHAHALRQAHEPPAWRRRQLLLPDEPCAARGTRGHSPRLQDRHGQLHGAQDAVRKRRGLCAAAGGQAAAPVRPPPARAAHAVLRRVCRAALLVCHNLLSNAPPAEQAQTVQQAAPTYVADVVDSAIRGRASVVAPRRELR